MGYQAIQNIFGLRLSFKDNFLPIKILTFGHKMLFLKQNWLFLVIISIFYLN
jgi:hypothetical protein